MTDKPIIVALDFDSAAAALALASRLDPALCRLKVGKELHTAAGPQIVDALMKQGFDIFLDLKFHDIPNTVGSACKVAASQGVWMMNVHASGGEKMIAAAREAVDSVNVVDGKKSLLIGVTVLTSVSQEDFNKMGFGFEGDLKAAVGFFGELAYNAHLDGVVCSAQDLDIFKWKRKEFLRITPGIRLAGDAAGDQSRIASPADAIKMGASYLVIGRSITGANDPIATLQQINHELSLIEQKATA